MWLGIDNGVTGSVAIIGNDTVALIDARGYTRKALRSGREIDAVALRALLLTHAPLRGACVERPFRGQHRTAVVSGAASDAAIRAVLEILAIPHRSVDSREWQKPYLGAIPAGTTKAASMARGVAMWPALRDQIADRGEADALFLARHAQEIFR